MSDLAMSARIAELEASLVLHRQEVRLLRQRLNYGEAPIKAIQAEVAEFYGIQVADISSRRRHKQLTWSRMVAMHFARSMTRMSLPEIGRAFGGRDHATVVYALRKVAGLIARDPITAAEVETIRRRLDRLASQRDEE